MHDFALWHNHLGHPSRDILMHIPKATQGVAFQAKNLPNNICHGCSLGKFRRSPFKESTSRATRVLELIHSDLVEFPSLSIDGFKWAATFLDDYSSFRRMYFLKHKSDTLMAFKSFVTWAECQQNNTVLRFRSDRGGEFMSKEFDSYLRDKGIEHETSVPMMPQQNGRAERWQQTIVRHAEAMHHYADLSDGFWKLAVDTAIHVVNRLPRKRLNWKTPIELLGRQSAGSILSANIWMQSQRNGTRRAKAWEATPKAVPMTFVGYEAGTKGYRFWNSLNPVRRYL